MRRREFIAALGGAAAALPVAVRAQTGGVRRVGVVHQGGAYEPSIDGLRDGLRAAGLEEGRHIALSSCAKSQVLEGRRKRRRAPWSATTRST